MRKSLLALAAVPALALGAGCTSILGDFSTSSGDSAEGGVDGSSGGGDDTGATTGHPDGGTVVSGDDGGANQTGTVLITAADVAVYVGQPAQLSATAPADAGPVTFAWMVTSAPPSSLVMTSMLGGANSATPSFTPDIAGTYVLHVVATEGKQTGARDVHVTASTAQVFYSRYVAAAQAVDDAAPAPAESYVVAGADGTLARSVTCPTAVSLASDPYYSGTLFDFWEPPAGKPYEFAGFYPTAADGGARPVQLVIGTSDSTCAAPPVAVGVYDANSAGMQPSFSPDGARVAFYDNAMTIMTIGADGTDVHIVAGYFAGEPDGGTPVYDPGANGYTQPPRVVWTADGQLAWARSTATGWQIVTAPDKIAATVTAYMDCLGPTPRQIKLLSDGTVITAYRPGGQDAPENLYRLKLDAGKDCAVQHQYTTVTTSDAGDPGYAADFSVSPDEKFIAFAAVDTSTQSLDPWQGGSYPGGYLYVAPVDGSTPPSQITLDAALNGPRWIAGGSAIAYTRIDTNPFQTQRRLPSGAIVITNNPPALSVRVVNATGGGAHLIDRGDGTGVVVTTAGNGGSCTMGRGAPAGAAWAGSLAGLAGLAFAARRRRKAKPSPPVGR